MTRPRFISASVLLLCLTTLGYAQNAPAEPKAPEQSTSAFLPPTFAGWQLQGKLQTSHDASSADPADAAILNEYGFNDFASGTYARDDGRTVTIRAARFADATGAFGAYTFYLQPDMRREEIGDQGASSGKHALFYRGQIVVDASFSQESPMSAAELRDLAGKLPPPGGNAGKLPSVLFFMPTHGYVANTQKLAVGPATYSTLTAPIPANQVNFSTDPDITQGQYTTPGGDATLLLIYYPNAQVAAAQLRQIDPRFKESPGVTAVDNTGQFIIKRTGPILAVASGPASESDLKSLLSRVNYEANVTWNQRTSLDASNDIGGLLVNIILLCFILGAMAIVAGIAFGGFRILMKRWFPDRVFDRPEQVEFIALRLSETTVLIEPEQPPEERSRPSGNG